jgi:hypothetical protein
MDLETQILQILGRYASLERATLLTLVISRGTYSFDREKQFDAALNRLRADGRAINRDGLYGRWMVAQPAPAAQHETPRTPDSRRGGRRARA